jgi:hypothetical protein
LSDVSLMFVAFLIMLNGFLRGRKKAQIEGVLGVTWVHYR